ncbi:MAG: biotin-dependent carboxyltransferase family protein [Mycobacterium sp.]|nr:biotin-dependent carboxyltransferase family protein [Mycobacterium sp.]
MTVLEVVAPGPLATIQDLGRPGLAHLGVTESGAADRRSHALANRLVANPLSAATIEVTLGGFTARVRGGDIVIAVTGADAAPHADGISLGHNSVAHIRDGQLITLHTPRAGLRSYLAVRGGLTATAVLGSRSYDTLARLGPPPLAAGDVIPVGRPGGTFPHVDVAPVEPPRSGPVELRVVPGPREDWLTDPDALVRSDWIVSDRSDRIGVRLVGEPLLLRRPERQLPSEGTVLGAIQIPPDGMPVILGRDHPVTGGYPVVGVVIDAHTDDLAQLRPAQTVGLRWA